MGVTSEQLDGQLESIPGVASAEVELTDDGPPVARVFLDGTRSPAEVRDRVEALLGAVVPDRPDSSEEPLPKRRRSGLGRGLGEVIESHDAQAQPAHLVGQPPAMAPAPVILPPSELTRVAVVETRDGVQVEVEDSLGKRSTARVLESIDDAIVDAVGDLLALGSAWDVSVSQTATDHGDAVVATALGPDGRRTAGAALVEYGRPWAVARALVAALGE